MITVKPLDTATCEQHGKFYTDGTGCPACRTEADTGTPVLSFYSRAQAIEDGVLIDVSSIAAEAGIKFPTALTQAVYAEYVKVPRGVIGQDEAGRLWDILWMLRCAISNKRKACDEINYSLHVRNDNRNPKLVNLKALCHPADTAAPVITILMPHED